MYYYFKSKISTTFNNLYKSHNLRYCFTNNTANSTFPLPRNSSQTVKSNAIPQVYKVDKLFYRSLTQVFFKR